MEQRDIELIMLVSNLSDSGLSFQWNLKDKIRVFGFDEKRQRKVDESFSSTDAFMKWSNEFLNT